MKILHLTDFHYDGSDKYKEDELRLIDSLSKSLGKFKGKIDFIFFTGDLVWKGNNIDDFHKAGKMFIERICGQLELPITSFFICPGNHDTYRGRELEEVTDSVMKIENNEELDNMATKNHGRSLKASLLNLENYFNFQNKFYTDHIKDYKDVQVDNMYTTHVRVIDNKKIGITTINSAWRANNSETDSGSLMYPPFYLKDAVREIKDCDIKILLLHHPLTDFRYWNQHLLEDIIYKDYHLMFSGHVHSNRDTLHITSDIGIYHSTSAATLSNIKDSIGFTVLSVNNETFELKVQNAIYNRPEELFYFGEEKLAQIPLNKEKENQNKFRKTIRKRFKEKSTSANKLFLSYKELKEENNFLELFTPPIIKEESQTNPKPKKSSNISLEKIINNKHENQIIFGKDKSGKSAILYRIVLKILHEFNDLKMLPLLINCNGYIKTNRKINIVELLSEVYEINRAKAKRLSEEYHIKILLDDFKENDPLILEPVAEYIKDNKNSSVVALGNETMVNSFTGGLIGDINFMNLYIHDITRSEIRMLTQKWPNISNDKRELVIEKIHKVFNQLNIPSNYWTVSLFIWIFEKNLDVNLGNNFQLIDLYIDNLLDKDNFILSKKYKIDFEDLKAFLADFAYHLVTNFHSKNYLLTYVEFINYVELYRQSNKKFVINTEDLVELVIEKGIVKKNSNGLYTFRLNGVFEYFLGFYMAYDEEFRNKVIEDQHFYLSFKNEFEVCAGIIPQDFDFISKIFEKTVNIFKPVNENVDTENLDLVLLSKVSDAFNITGDFNKVLKRTLKDSLAPDQQDSILETINPSTNRISDVKPKKYYQSIGTDSVDLENALYILGRVFRNSKLRKKDDFNDKVFDFILNSTCTFSLSLIEEISSQNVSEIDDNISEEQLIKLLTQFLPIVAQTFFFDMTVQSNLELILKEKIENLKKSKKGNELKLLILYFSLIDLDLKANLHLIEEIIELINIPILKQTTVFKLYLYLSFKCNGNKSLQNKIEKFIKKQELEIDSSQNFGLIEQKIKAIEKTNKKKV